MTLQLRRKKDGSLASQYWYADFFAHGRRRVVALKVPVEGKLPDRNGKGGDAAFFKSKGKAQHVHDETVRDAHTKAGADKLVERVLEIKSGEKFKSVKLSDLREAWKGIPRKREPKRQHVQDRLAILGRFVDYMKLHYPKAKTLVEASKAAVKGFMDAEHARGLSDTTWNAYFELLRSTFKHLEPGAEGYRKYLAITPTKNVETIHRQPFTGDDMAAIMEAAKDDDLMRPVITTALCTAMRRGDCCLVKWSSVDLPGGFITVKTGKTGETVEIPIMPMLRDELVRAAGAKGNRAEGFVWKNAAAMYQRNADGLNVRLRAILRRAGFVDAETAAKLKAGEQPSLLALPPADVLQRGLKAIDSKPVNEAKRQQIRQVFTQYMDGQSVKQIAQTLLISTSTVSKYLNDLEQAIGVAVIRRPGADLPAQVRGVIHADGNGQRLKRGSLRGWHSFRTTFITLALTAGLPMELVRRVTGHTTVDVVLKNYFRPGRDEFKRAFQAAMPKLLTNGQKTPKEEALEILDATTAKTWKRDAARVRELVAML